MLRLVAALFVETNGCYAHLPGVELWDVVRDARLYAGPHPVVAHPPCDRWGKFWFGSPSSSVRFEKGDDGGCFASALASVRTYGGVLEHPEGSSAWAHFGLNRPVQGAWIVADQFGGWTTCVEQGAYGHRARKPTWLYLVGCAPPPLLWHKTQASIPEFKGRGWTACDCCEGEYWCFDHNQHAFECPCPPIEEMTKNPYVLYERGARSANDAIQRMGKKERLATPLPFRDLLLDLARQCRAPAVHV